MAGRLADLTAANTPPSPPDKSTPYLWRPTGGPLQHCAGVGEYPFVTPASAPHGSLQQLGSLVLDPQF